MTSHVSAAAGIPPSRSKALDAVGTSSDPIIFTSINDNSVDGDTGSGSPAAGDWEGIGVGEAGSANIEYAMLRYAATAIEAVTDENVTIENNVFTSKSTAVEVAATVGTNAATHGNWFDGNDVALSGSSDWNPLTVDGLPLCQFIPEMDAGGNRYGASQSRTPFFSSADSEAISLLLAAGAEESPDGWTDGIGVGPTDQVSYAEEPCFSLDDGDLIADVYVVPPSTSTRTAPGRVMPSVARVSRKAAPDFTTVTFRERLAARTHASSGHGGSCLGEHRAPERSKSTTNLRHTEPKPGRDRMDRGPASGVALPGVSRCSKPSPDGSHDERQARTPLHHPRRTPRAARSPVHGSAVGTAEDGVPRAFLAHV